MNAPRPRIAFLVDQLGGGGAQRVAVLTARSLHDLGERTTLLSARGGSFASEIPEGLPVRILAPSWPSPAGVLQFLYNLRRTVRQEEIGVIFTNGFTIGRLVLLARSAGWLTNLSVVVVEHSTLSVALAARFPNRYVLVAIRRATSWLYRRADTIIGVSQGVSRDLEMTLHLATNSVITIHNPVNQKTIVAAINADAPEVLTQFFESLPRPIVITAGRLVTAKAHYDLLASFVLLPSEFQGSLVILGEGPLRSGLRRRAEQLGISERVWMPGHIANPWWFIARSNAFVLSSHWEGFGLVLVEALICGVPIVSTDCPSGPREILAEEPTARLTQVANPLELARATAAVLQLTPNRLQSDRVRTFDPKVAASHYMDVLNDIFR